jgi:hypothetical protein
VRAVLILLAATGCSQILGIEAPQRLDAAVADATQDDAPPDVGMRMTLTFQNGVGGYTSARDTWIDSGAPNMSRENDSPLHVRNAERWSLLAFDALFGDTPTQIPPTATIDSAHLDVFIATNNCQASLADIVVPWADTVTYNTFGPTPGPQMTEDFSTPFAVVPTTLIGKVSIDVTNSVKAWKATPAGNNGWLFVPTGGTNDCAIRSSDENQAQLHPLLSVTYVP